MESLSIIDSVKIGQSISCDCSYTKDNGLVFTNLGNAKLPLLDNPIDKATESSGSFNWICIGEDYQGNALLLADRCLINFLPASDAYLERIINSCGDSIKIDGREYILNLPARNMWKRVVVEGEPGTPKESDTWHWDKPCYTYEAIDTNNMWAVGGKTAGTESSASYFNANDCYMRPVLTVIKPTIIHTPGVAAGIELVDSIDKIQPGKAIACEYAVESTNTLGTFSNLGKATLDPLPVEIAYSDHYAGTFYWICIGYDYQGYPKMVADRVIQSNIAPDTILDKFPGNAGDEITIDDHEYCKLRCLSSKYNTTIDIKNGQYGEYDALMVLYDAYGIKASDEVFHTDHMRTILGQANESLYGDDRTVYDQTRIGTPYLDKPYAQGILKHDTPSPNAGFRPVFIYCKPKDPNRGKVGCTLPLPPKGVKIAPVVAVPCRYTVTTKGAIGTFSKFGVDGTDYISAEGEPTPDGIFYWICIGFTHQGYLKFVADRNIQNNISWTTLDEAGYTTTEGVITNIDGRDSFRLRLPGTIPDHICDSNHYGEWDGIITLYNKGGIKPSDPSIWNIENTISWTMTPFFDDPANYIVGRGMQNMQDNLESGIAQKKLSKDLCNGKTGFRPVMYYESLPSKFFAVFESMQNRVGYDVFDPLRW